jgi:hypothetical protein
MKVARVAARFRPYLAKIVACRPSSPVVRPAAIQGSAVMATVLRKLGTLAPNNEKTSLEHILKEFLTCSGPVFLAERKSRYRGVVYPDKVSLLEAFLAVSR